MESPFDDIRQISTSEEYIIFVIDASGSMDGTDTYDEYSKAFHVEKNIKSVLTRMHNSNKKDSFKVSLIYFAANTYITKYDGMPYFSPKDALDNINQYKGNINGGGTNITQALKFTLKTIEQFIKDPNHSDDKHATVILLTDGHDNNSSKESVREAASQLVATPICPNLATIAFGNEADHTILKEIATTPTDDQRYAFKKHELDHHIHDTLFLDVTRDEKISQDSITIIRNFMNVLSDTVK